MKKIIFVLIILVSNSLFAETNGIYCDIDGKRVSAMTREGRLDCADDLITGSGRACFTGDRQVVIGWINDRRIHWGQQEWLDNAKVNGQGIAYDYVDAYFRLTQTFKLSRCN